MGEFDELARPVGWVGRVRAIRSPAVALFSVLTVAAGVESALWSPTAPDLARLFLVLGASSLVAALGLGRSAGDRIPSGRSGLLVAPVVATMLANRFVPDDVGEQAWPTFALIIVAVASAIVASTRRQRLPWYLGRVVFVVAGAWVVFELLSGVVSLAGDPRPAGVAALRIVTLCLLTGIFADEGWRLSRAWMLLRRLAGKGSA